LIVGRGWVEVGVVKDVESLHPELNIELLRDARDSIVLEKDWKKELSKSVRRVSRHSRNFTEAISDFMVLNPAKLAGQKPASGAFPCQRRSIKRNGRLATTK
jgi:hypothetical protein